MDVKQTKKKTMVLYLFSTIAVLKHMSLNENKVQFRKKNICRCVIYKKTSTFFGA